MGRRAKPRVDAGHDPPMKMRQRGGLLHQRAQVGVITICHEVELDESAPGIANVVHLRIGPHDVAGLRPRVRPDAHQPELVCCGRQKLCAGFSRQGRGEHLLHRTDEAADADAVPRRRFLS